MHASAARGDASKNAIYTVLLSAAAVSALLGALLNASLLAGPPFYTALALLAAVLYASGLVAIRAAIHAAAHAAADRPDRLEPIERTLAVVAVVLYLVLLWHGVYQSAPGGAASPAGPYATVAYLLFPFVAIHLFVAFSDRSAIGFAYGTLAMCGVVLFPSLAALARSAPVPADLGVPLLFLLGSGVLVGLLNVFAGFVRRLQRAEVTAAAMRRIANTDVLTGLANRRRMEMLLTQEQRRAQRYARPLSILLIDVDDFKRINDTYGHQAGDEVLIGLARDLRGSLRVSDHLGRWGGEEFLIVLPETDRRDAGKLAESVRVHVSARGAGEGAEHFRVTVSIGVASHRDGDRPDDILARADAALYRAKRGGRDRVRLEEVPVAGTPVPEAPDGNVAADEPAPRADRVPVE